MGRETRQSPEFALRKTSFFSPMSDFQANLCAAIAWNRFQPDVLLLDCLPGIYSAAMSSALPKSQQPAFPAFRLGPWKVAPNLNELSKGDRSVRIQGQQMALLVQLARAQGEPVSREELLNNVWGQRAVTDDVLSRSVAALRAALGDDAKSPQYIETIPKKGYRLIAPPRFTGRARSKVFVVTLVIALAIAAAATWWGTRDSHQLRVLPDPAAFAENFTARPGVETYPTLSPDGHYLAYVENQPGQQTLLVADAASRRIRSTWDAPGLIRGLAFASTADRIALISRENNRCDVVVLTLLTGDANPLASCWGEEPTGITWSRDSRHLVFVQSAPGAPPGLAALDLSTGDVTRLTQPPEHKSDLFPAFSPDGNQLSFSRGDDTTREIYALNWQQDELGINLTESLERLTNDNQLALRHAWLSDYRVIFSSDRAARQGLWMLDLNRGTTALLGARGARQPSISNNGDLAYQVAIFEANLWRISLTNPTRKPQLLVQSRRYDNHPTFSPDGTRLLFLSNRSGKSALWLSNPDGSEQSRVYEADDGRLTRPTWSHDGQWMVGVIYRAESSKVIRIPRSGGQPDYVESFGTNVVQVISLGENIWATINEGQTGSSLTVWGLGKSPLRFEDLNPNHIALGPDGTILYSVAGEAGIHQLNPQTRSSTMLVADLPANRWNAWTSGLTAVYYASDAQIHRKPFAADAPEVISALIPNAIGLTMATNPEESQLLVTRTDHVEIDIMLAQNFLQKLMD